MSAATRLRAEAVQGPALALERVHDVERGDRLAAGVLGVGDRVADDVLEEDLEDAAGLLVDEARDTLDATTARQAADGRLSAFERRGVHGSVSEEGRRREPGRNKAQGFRHWKEDVDWP